MKFVFYYMLDGLKDVFFPSISVPRLKLPSLITQEVKIKPHPTPKKVSYQPPKSIRKDDYLRKNQQR